MLRVYPLPAPPSSRNTLSSPRLRASVAPCPPFFLLLRPSPPKQHRGELRAHAAGDENEAPVRGELAEPVEGAAVDQRHVVARRAAHVDHEAQSVVVVVLERLARDGNAAYAGGD